MRLALPVIAFAFVSLLYWLAGNDASEAMQTFPPAMRDYAAIVSGIAFWLCAAWLASALLTTAILGRVRRQGPQNKLPKLLIDVVAIVVYAVAGVVILSRVLHFPLGGVLATSGVLAAVIGLAVQKTISDIMAGIALNFEQGFKLGDWIEIGSGTVGEVSEITWRSTRLITIDGRMIVVPNSMLVGNQFSNLNAPHRSFRIRKTIRLDHGVPTERAMAILQTAMSAAEGVLTAPSPVVLIEELDDSGVLYGLHFWVSDYPASFAIATEVMAKALKFLDLAGIAPVNDKLEIALRKAGERRIERGVDIAVLMRRTPVFAAFGEESLALLAKSAELRELSPDVVVVHEGDAGESLFIVVAGLLRVSKRFDGMEDRAVGQLAPGDVFGEMSLLTGTARSTTVTTTTPAMLLEISKEHLEPILTNHPSVIAELSQLQADRMATNESILALWPDERQDIVRMGMAAFLRRKIARFFGRAEG